MKRYLLFYGDNYYPSGGWGDFHGSFDTIQEAQQVFLKTDSPWKPDWYQIVDTTTGKEVTV